MRKPVSGKDFPVFYQGYVHRVPAHTSPFSILIHQMVEFKSDLTKLQDVDFMNAYSTGKWTIGQLIRHCIDTEKIFAYRALCIARNDITPIRSFDENAYTEAAGKIHDKETLLHEFEAVRYSTALFFEKLDSNLSGKYGTFENGEIISLTAMAYIIAGHWMHHKHILQERYDVKF